MRVFITYLLVLLSGCAPLASARGTRPLHEPYEEGYQVHLTSEKQSQPVLVAFCNQFGNPDGIEIGFSGTYYAWKTPRMILSIKKLDQEHPIVFLRFYPNKYDYLLGADTGEYKVNSVSPNELLADPEGVLANARKDRTVRTTIPVAPSVRPAVQQQVLYSIVDFHRIAESEFGYAFRLKISNANVNLSTIRSIKDELRHEVLNDYRATFPNARSNSLQVDFPQFDVSKNEICGCAEVMSFAIMAMDYKQESRHGIIKVRIGASSFEEARKWVRSNIETLSRDKNIALTTGEIPPAAQFILGAERVLEGGILEVEFETL